MNHWQVSVSPRERLKLWRTMRQQLENIEDDVEVLNTLCEWWKNAPTSVRVIDPYDNKDWPDPWELIYNDQFDDNVIALGMCYTLELSGWPCTLQLIQCNKKNEIKLIINVDDEYILNYTYGQVDLVESVAHCEILHSWESSELTD